MISSYNAAGTCELQNSSRNVGSRPTLLFDYLQSVAEIHLPVADLNFEIGHYIDQSHCFGILFYCILCRPKR